jgi:hypothetical protein
MDTTLTSHLPEQDAIEAFTGEERPFRIALMAGGYLLRGFDLHHPRWGSIHSLEILEDLIAKAEQQVRPWPCRRAPSPGGDEYQR